MTNFIYQSKIDNSINNADTEASFQANANDILGGVNKLDVSSSPALTKSSNYLRSQSNVIGVETITSEQFLCDLLMAGKKAECNSDPIVCPEGKSKILDTKTGSMGCGCASDKKINNANNLVDKIMDSPYIVNILKECDKKIKKGIFDACLGPSFFEELDSIGSSEADLDKIIKDSITQYKKFLPNNNPDELSSQLELLKAAISSASSEPNPSAEAALDHLISRINECKQSTDQDCVAKTWPSPTTLKAILENISVLKTCESQGINGSDDPETIDKKNSKLNEQTCECECEPGYQYCALNQACIKCIEGAVLYESPAVLPFGIDTSYCVCDCPPGKRTYKLPDGTTTPCVDPCQDGYVFSKVPCNTPASVIQVPNTSECYGCICKKSTGTWPFNTTETVTDTCEVENSEPRADKSCECDCKKGTVRHDNPSKGSPFWDGSEPYRCEPPCPVGETYSWIHRKCIEDRCYKLYEDTNPNTPPSECYDGKELDEDCKCSCPAGTTWTPAGSGSDEGSCDCPPDKQKVFNPNRPNTIPSKNPVYGQDYVCIKCKQNEVYSWTLKRCIVIASGPNNNLRSINVNNFNFNIINHIELL